MTDIRPTLYKRNTDGSIQTWYQEIDGAKYRTHSGKLNGKLVTSEWTVAEGKNIGKSNETTPEQQADIEVGANYVKKQKSGYFENIAEIDTSTKFKPMLAANYDDVKIDLNKEVWFSQPKLDGIRCISRSDGLWTRSGERIATAPHIEKLMKDVHQASAGLVFDGELYVHSLSDNFNEMSSVAKNAEKADGFLQYWIYDVVSSDLSDDNSPFEERLRTMSLILEEHQSEFIIPVQTSQIVNQDDTDSIYEWYLEQGYEGQMLRRGDSAYEHKRSKNLLKRKTFMDQEFTILDVIEGLGNKSGLAATIRVDIGNGQVCDATCTGTDEYRKQLLLRKNELIDKQATIKFFNRTPGGSLRFPTVKAIHETERW